MRLYFESNDRVPIKHSRYIDEQKQSDITRLLIINPHEFCLLYDKKINMLKQKYHQIQIDGVIMSKTNTKWTIQNKERMRAKLALLHRNIKLIVANSNDYNLTDRE